MRLVERLRVSIKLATSGSGTHLSAMSLRVLRLAEVLAVMTTFGAAASVIVLSIRIAFGKIRRSEAVGTTQERAIDDGRFARTLLR